MIIGQRINLKYPMVFLIFNPFFRNLMMRMLITFINWIQAANRLKDLWHETLISQCGRSDASSHWVCSVCNWIDSWRFCFQWLYRSTFNIHQYYFWQFKDIVKSFFMTTSENFSDINYFQWDNTLKRRPLYDWICFQHTCNGQDDVDISWYKLYEQI